MNPEINENDASIALLQHGIGNPTDPIEAQKALMKRAGIIANYRKGIEAKFANKIADIQDELNAERARMDWLHRGIQFGGDDGAAGFLDEWAVFKTDWSRPIGQGHTLRAAIDAARLASPVNH